MFTIYRAWKRARLLVSMAVEGGGRPWWVMEVENHRPRKRASMLVFDGGGGGGGC